MITALLKKPESCLFGFYLVILIWAPLPFASNRPWGGGLLALLVSTAFASWLVLYLAGRTRLHPDVWRRGRLPLALLLLVQCWVALQLLPLPRAVVQILSPQALLWHIRDGWLPLSLDVESGKYHLLLGVTYSAAFFLTLGLVNSRRRLKILLMALVFSGTLQALYAVFMVLSGLELGFFVEKYAGKGVATGTFVNRNHFAGYLVMCLGAGTGLLLSQLGGRSPVGWRDWARHGLQLLLDPRFRLRIYLAIMVIALVLTRSRMGNLVFFGALGLAGALALFSGRRLSKSLLALLASLFVVDVLILSRWFGFEKLLTRLQNSSPGGEERVWSNQFSFDYVENFALTGSGGGSFHGIFPNFQGPDLQGFHLHAHNDYLEFAAELGLPVAGILGLFVYLALYSAYRVQRHRATPIYRGAAFAVVVAVCWVALHSLADFNMQIPANALTFVTILALAFVSRGLPGARVAPSVRA